ncbi:MAG: flagellar export protein FliJ [Caulobacteraceae bacterium]|nr:flagellar export protein FliJ [Caulobacteraceae bacterium]
MGWRASLVKLSSHEVQQLQLRLAEIGGRRIHAEMRLASMTAEGEAESAGAARDAEAGWWMIGYKAGLKARKEACQLEISQLEAEETGARDALTAAFEALKRHETIAANAETARKVEASKRETAALDEIALRAATR